jgi:NAD(P)H-dependent flavin oxidoreductase YrpB (nitropropane dioxygenase family)
VDASKLVELGLPFWLAGGYGEPWRLREALAAGAAGIQVGTAFAFCAESGITAELKRQAVRLSREGRAEVFTDPRASPTGFPFKVARMAGTLSEREAYERRARRTCDLGYLRRPYRRSDATVGYRCPAEPIAQYAAKGGTEETEGRKCLCNALFATVGLGQRLAEGQDELPLVTAGDGLVRLARLVQEGQEEYTAKDVVEYLLGAGLPAGQDSSTDGTPVSRPRVLKQATY